MVETTLIALTILIGSMLVWWLRTQLVRARIDLDEARLRATKAEQALAAEARLRATFEERAQNAAVLAGRIIALEAELTLLRSESSDLRVAAARLERDLEAERTAGAEKLRLVEASQAKLATTFRALSAEALQAQSAQLLQLAEERFAAVQKGADNELELQKQAVEQLVLPMRESLSRVDVRLGELELSRATAYEGLLQQVKGLAESQGALRTETARLVTALRTPHVRGRWGEETLKRVVELAGMSSHCDFAVQPSAEGDEGRLRPDMVVRLAGGKSIVIDAKVPLSAYLLAVEATDEEERKARLLEHAAQVRTHVGQLARKAYWEQFQPAPEFVVLFLGDGFYAAAVQSDPELLAWAINQRVIPATPGTLIALLRTVAYGWREERLAENARQISDLGKELHKRLADLASHITRLGRSLQGSVDHFNRAVGSLESRVLVSARKFRDLDAAGDAQIVALEPIDHAARLLNAPELVAIEGGGQKSGTEG